MLKKIYELFGIQPKLDDEKKGFVQRINQTIYSNVEKRQDYGKLFRRICYSLGENADDRIAAANQYRKHSYDMIIPTLRSLTKDNFENTIKILWLVYSYIDESEFKKEIDEWIKIALAHAVIDIGVKWADGEFYPSGAKILDEKLIDDPLGWLQKYPPIKEHYGNALKDYYNKQYNDSVGNCYLALEGFVRSVLGNDRTLDNNKEDLLKYIDISQEWKAILNKFIDYANEYKRHASKKLHEVKPREVEAFVYFTGLLLRLLLEANAK